MRHNLIFSCVLVWFNCVYTLPASRENESVNAPRVAMIGAGVSGLAVARHLKDTGVNLTVFELTPCPGGTWRYDPRVGVDEFGDPIQTSMYRDLRTNLPKDVMHYPDYPLPEDLPEFPTDEDIYQYLIKFMLDFGLEKFIKFNHKVTHVERLRDVWLVAYKNRETGELCEEVFDYVIVGTGHTSTPNWPESISGEENFKGRIIHSHDYRVPEAYTNKSVVVVGMGPSAVDIAVELLPYASHIYLSHRGKHTVEASWPPHFEQKPGIKAYTDTGIIFTDGSYADVGEVIYGTGYKYDHPFLADNCGITTFPKFLIPLHKLIVNINEPTMFFIGSVSQASNLVCSDVQARYVASLISGNFSLPSKVEMMDAWLQQVGEIQKTSGNLANLHLALGTEEAYYNNLASEAGLPPIPPVLAKIRTENVKARRNLDTYRSYNYEIVDDEHFVRSLIDNNGNVAKQEYF